MSKFTVDNNVAALRDPNKFSYWELLVITAALMAYSDKSLSNTELRVIEELLEEINNSLLDSKLR